MPLLLRLVLAVSVIACSSATFNGVELSPAEPAPALRLADSTGRVFDLSRERGKVVLVFFGYTHCPDICPTTLADWKRAADSLGALALETRFVFVSVDPERDTPGVAQRYAARFSPAFLGLTGSRAEIDSALAGWRLAAFRDGIPGDTSTSYTVSHPSQVFVIDPGGRLRLMHRAGLTPMQIRDDIRALL